jgi:hypothetical protein
LFGAAITCAHEAPPQLLAGLGPKHHPITTQSPLAQRYFDQGLNLCFGFNHEAAIRAFEAALEIDPSCAMCEWGIAFALGPNINAPMAPETGPRAHAAAQRALAKSARASEREQAYIRAVAARYAAEPVEDRSALDRAYADAMRSVHQADPSDADAAALFAEALMDLSPWNYWMPDLEPRENTLEALAVLEAVLQARPDHIGANHFYIHMVEMPYPERGVAAAERLRTLAPDAGHLVHMPSHIFWRVGRYDDAFETNRSALRSDERFFATCRAAPFYRTAYYVHNLHFLWAAAATEGRSEVALTAAGQLEAESAAAIESYPFLEEQLAIPHLTLARFGRWDALLTSAPPPASRVYLTGIWHYARGLAFVRTGSAREASEELAALDALAGGKAAAELMLAGGVASAAQLLSIGSRHLAGEIAASAGDTAGAVAALEDAVARQDALPYMEPPPWYFPTRQALGAVLLDAGRAAQAEAVYRADLERYPNNGWSLYGLAASLRAQREAEAERAQQGFAAAWARADVALHASRF